MAEDGVRMPQKGESDSRGVLIAAENGPVVEWDESGLVMRLSDRVVRDIARRMPRGSEQGFGLPADILGDIDAWDVFQKGDWIGFQARLPSGMRRYRRHVSGGAILAQTGGSVWLLAGLGGARRQVTYREPLGFPHHVIRAPLSDEGEAALVVPQRSVGLQALVADKLMARRFASARALRTVLADDVASERLPEVLAGHERLCQSLGQPAQILAVGMEFGPGMTGDPLAAMDEAGRMRFVTSFDCGPYWQEPHPAIWRQSALALRPGIHDLTFAGAGYAFAQDDLGHPLPEGLHHRAALEALAIEARLAGEAWFCPTACFAEAEGSAIRVTFKSASDLAIDRAPCFAGGDMAGFTVDGAALVGVGIAPDDPRAVLLHLAAPPANGTRVAYARPDGRGSRDGDRHYPAGGALRDQFSQDGLHRWALPFDMTVTQC